MNYVIMFMVDRPELIREYDIFVMGEKVLCLSTISPLGKFSLQCDYSFSTS